MLALRGGDHVGASFGSAGQFADRTVDFAEQGIAAGAQVTVFPGDPGRDTLPGFRDALARRSAVIARAVIEGRVRVADSREVLLAPGRFDPDHLHAVYTAATDEAVSAGYRGLWVSVDMTWAAGADPDALVAFEAGAFPLFSAGRLTAMCLYDRSVFPAARVARACQAHPAAPTSVRPLRHRGDDAGTLVLSGETDTDNHAAFLALLGSVRSGGRLDISGMSFLDVRAMVAVAERRGPALTVTATPRQHHLLDLMDSGLRPA